MGSYRHKAFALGALAIVAGAFLYVRSPARPEVRSPESAPSAAARDPRLVLSRPWFDKMPSKRTDVTDLWFFFAGGIGLEDKGSSFRSTLEIFELERQGSRLDIVFLQDQKKQTVKFAVKSCSDKPEFDLCLELTPPVRGVSKLYGWGDDEEMDRAMPWGREWRKAAEVKARAAKP